MGEKEDLLEGTRLDRQLHRPRSKSGIVPSDTRIYLRVVQGPATGTVFDLSTGGRYLIGRQSGEIPLNDAKVSTKHAEINIAGPGACFIVDLASTNGTFLNGVRIERKDLRHNDEVRVGDTRLHLDVLEGTRPLSPV
jgi:pSer/pThr/pTyr-binding forkhead associated (FHA) protein